MLDAFRRKRISAPYALLVMALLFFAVLCVIPFWYVLTSSLSDPQRVKEGAFRLLPTGFSLDAYRIVFRDVRFFNGFKITVLRTVIGTALALSVQTMMAYALSRRMPGRGLIRRLVVVTILFSGGIIPTYLVIQSMNLLDTFWALVLPMVFNPWNVLLLISFFASLPDAIEESAKLDGAGDFRIFIKLAVPLSIPAIATILLFIAVRHWNELLDGVIYINSSQLKPMQVYLIELVMRSSTNSMIEPTEQAITAISIQTAVIFASCLPIIIVYPFLQRFFVKGILVGAVKG